MQPIQPGPGQESVWNYPRPPALESCDLVLEVVFGGAVVASTCQGFRVLETSHPPTYYFPPGDVDRRYLLPESHRSFCEWKGVASYYGIVAPGGAIQPSQRVLSQVAWSYGEPTLAFLPLKDYVAFYAEPFYGQSGSTTEGEAEFAAEAEAEFAPEGDGRREDLETTVALKGVVLGKAEQSDRALLADGCYVGGERVQPQPGNFYGGWITSNILGPFKGIPGSWGW